MTASKGGPGRDTGGSTYIGEGTVPQCPLPPPALRAQIAAWPSTKQLAETVMTSIAAPRQGGRSVPVRSSRQTDGGGSWELDGGADVTGTGTGAEIENEMMKGMEMRMGQR